MAYNNFYQRLCSGGSARDEQTQMVGQSLSPHRAVNSGPPMASRPGTNAGLIQPGLAAPGQLGSCFIKPPSTSSAPPIKSVAFYPPIPQEDNQTEDPGEPVCRAGRLGAPWRHVRQCTGNQGNHICFIDGNVKQNDMTSYPPYGYTSPEPYMAPQQLRMSSPVQSQLMAGHIGSNSSKYNNSFNNHAKRGFKYWYEEKKGLPAYSLESIPHPWSRFSRNTFDSGPLPVYH